MENSRFDHELSRGRWLPDDGIFTPEEINLCNSDPKPARRFAACFAAKEAVLKALGMPVSDLAMFREVQMKKEGAGNYTLVLHGRVKRESERRGVMRLKVSLDCSSAWAGAVVILES